MSPLLTEALTPILAQLRAQYFIYQTAHWQVSGKAFYGNHLLFQRLYEAVAEDTDKLAERMVGLNGGKSVDPTPVLQIMAIYVQDWEKRYSCPFERAFHAEKVLYDHLQKAHEDLKAAGQLSLGLDDLIMSLCSRHEENMYLIQQVLVDPPGERFASWTFCEVPK